ncbi:MAG TPA: CvpA family protein [Oleiagrimonas sp.]|nr:CvpA family protein [Oleiagrimonas sp.]
MNWADYAIIAVLALSVLVGLWRGLISEVLALAIWVAAFWVAWMFGPRVATAFQGSIDQPSIRIILGYVLCFVGVLIVGALIKFVMAKLIQGTGLSGSDRMLGMLFGLARGVLLVALLVFLLGFTPFTRDPWWHQSKLLPTFITTADWLGRHVPESVRRYLHTHSPSQPHIEVPLTGLPKTLTAVSDHAFGALTSGQPAAASTSLPVQATRLAPGALSRDN